MARFGFSPLNVSWMNISKNVRKISETIHNAAKRDIEVLFFPESSLTGFACTESSLTVSAVDSCLDLLNGHSQHAEISVLLGAFLQVDKRVKNSIVQVGRGVDLPEIRYSKINLFELAGEHNLCSPGDHVTSVSLGNLKVGLLICFDLRSLITFEETVSQEVDLIVVIANWPSTRHSHFTSLLHARALDSGVPVIGLNRSGADPIAGDYVGGAFGFFQNGDSMDFEVTDEIYSVELSKEIIASRFPTFKLGLR